MRNLKNNIWKMYCFKSIKTFLVIMPILVLFFQENGLTMREVFLLQSIFSIAIVLFELPSCYFADIFGRKVSIICGAVLSFLGMLTYSFSYGFFGFLISELMLGLGVGFISGADSALIYDTLLKLKKVKEYTKVQGRFISTGYFSEGIAAILGGFLATISLRAPFYAEAIVIFFTIPLAFSLVEPPRKKLIVKEGHIVELLKILKLSMKDHHEIKWLIIYASIISTSTLTMAWFIQPYLQLVGLQIALFGIVWAAYHFALSVFSWNAHKIEDFLGRKTSLISLIFLVLLAYFLTSQVSNLFGVVILFLIYFIRGFSNPVISCYVNNLISSKIRATVLSVKNLMGRLIFSVIGPFLGWVSDVYTLQTALLLSGLLFFFFGLLALLFLHKNKAL